MPRSILRSPRTTRIMPRSILRSPRTTRIMPRWHEGIAEPELAGRRLVGASRMGVESPTRMTRGRSCDAIGPSLYSGGECLSSCLAASGSHCYGR
jgi:hypothetical protein